MVPVNLASTCEPGVADFESKVSAHCTGSSAAMASDARAKKETSRWRYILVGLCGGGNAGHLADGELRLDPFVHFSFGEFGGYANGVLDGIGIGAAVSDDANTLYAEQRRAAIFGVIYALLEFLERGARKHVTDLSRNGGFQRFAQHLINHLDQAFAHLQRYVTDKTIADDYVGIASINIAPFHVADKVNGERLEQRSGGARQFVALVLFFTNGKQPDSGSLGVEDYPRVDVAHHGELREHARRAIDIGAYIDHNHRCAFECGKGGCHRRPVDARKHALHH